MNILLELNQKVKERIEKRKAELELQKLKTVKEVEEAKQKAEDNTKR